MEFSVAQKALLAMPSRWPPIFLGIVLSLLISAICTYNFAMRAMPASESSSSASSSLWAPSTSSGLSNQLFFFLFRSSHAKAAAPHQGNPHQSTISEGPSSSFGGNFLPAASSISSKDVMEMSNNSSGSTYTEHRPLSHEVKLPRFTDSTNDRSPSSPANVSDLQTLSDDKLDMVLPGDGKLLSASQKQATSKPKQCDISIGSWVEDASYPLYSPSTCPFVDESFNCQQNSRPDSKYNKWRWTPRDCDVPRFNGTHFLEILRGKRLVFVGDSLNRNQWESMLCMLRETLLDKTRLVQVHGGRVSKLPGAYVFKFLDYDFKVEFYTSPYLVNKEDGLNYTDFRVRLDRMDISERRWRKADVLVFNTGHWWTPDKIGQGENRFQEGEEVYKLLSIPVAYHKALSTWGKWVDTYVDPKNTTVFFRGYSPIHYFGGQWDSGGQCQDETEPIFNETFIVPYPATMQTLDEVLQQMKVPVQVLNITRLSDFRKDGHPALYGHVQQSENQYQDCSHWCLPGVPDTWNELLYFALLNKQQDYRSP